MNRLEDQIRSYTQTIDAMTPSVDSLLPAEATGEAERVPHTRVEVARLGPPTRRKPPLPDWVVGVAAAALILLLSIPTWLWFGASDRGPVATTVPTTVATTVPPTVATTAPVSPPEPTTPPDGETGVTKQETTICGVEWAADIGVVRVPDCSVTNTRHADGSITLSIRGQVSADSMDAFTAAGVTEFATPCLVNYLFVVQDGDPQVFVDSVRHFTPDGQMTETCEFTAGR